MNPTLQVRSPLLAAVSTLRLHFPIAALTFSALAACSQAPDMSAIANARSAPVQRYDTTQALASNGTLLVAATQNGALLTSMDGGLKWNRTELGGNTSIIDLAACPDGSFVGLDFNRRVWSTGRDARTWTAHAIAQPRTPLAITCAPDATWWVVGTNATLASSVDGGATWRTNDLDTDAQLTAVKFFDASNGVAVGEFGLQISTRDGGKSWTRQAPIPNDFYSYSMLFLDQKQGWVSGLAGQVLHTADGGASWQPQENTSHQALYRLFLVGGVPYGAGASGTVAKLADGKWMPVPVTNVPPAFLAGATGLAEQPGLVVGGPGGLLAKVDTANATTPPIAH
ncbi:MAG: YCF48-related protein [Telluria sp.]|nr:YCF48-related protein [Telluria sp.]